MRARIQESRSIDAIMFNESKRLDLFKKIESLVSENEPLIISLISTVYEDLKEIHSHLNVFCAVDPSSEEIRKAQAFF